MGRGRRNGGKGAVGAEGVGSEDGGCDAQGVLDGVKPMISTVTREGRKAHAHVPHISSHSLAVPHLTLPHYPPHPPALPPPPLPQILSQHFLKYERSVIKHNKLSDAQRASAALLAAAMARGRNGRPGATPAAFAGAGAGAGGAHSMQYPPTKSAFR